MRARQISRTFPDALLQVAMRGEHDPGSMTPQEVRDRRTRAQLLHHRREVGGVVEAVRHLLAVQAQDAAAYPLALRARVQGLTAGELTTVRETRKLVRCWGP